MTGEAARWVIGPRSFRRLVPVLGWLGPLGFGRPAQAFAAQVDAILAADDAWPTELGEIDVPTLVVVGNQDILTPRGDSEELAERIPTAELVVISGAAHGLMIEHATTFNRVLLRLPPPRREGLPARCRVASQRSADVSASIVRSAERESAGDRVRCVGGEVEDRHESLAVVSRNSANESASVSHAVDDRAA